MSTSRARTSGLVVAVLVAMAAVAGGAYVATKSLRSVPVTSSGSVKPVPAVLSNAARAPRVARPLPGTPAHAAGVASALAPVLRTDALGPRVRAQVVDVESGTVLLDRAATAPTAPASTAKLLTAAALLMVRHPTDRITTSLVTDGAGTLVLVGGGDPTLSAAPAGTPTLYSGAARLSDLAAKARATAVPVRRIIVDDSMFTGPAVSPGWAAEDVPSSYGAAITAVMADGGRDQPGDEIRSADPDLAAGRSLARLLGRDNLSVKRGTVTAATSQTVAQVRSAQFSTLVGQMLQDSDNVIAECLARQVALAERAPASFTGAAKAIRRVVSGLGVDPGGRLVDGSGLAPQDRVDAAALVAVLRLAAAGSKSGLRAMLSGLPIAGWSGTLKGRYIAGRDRSGAGLVRAKTGTLSGVSALAGLVHDRDGRLLAFALIADRAPSTDGAETALDTIAATLAACGCR